MANGLLLRLGYHNHYYHLHPHPTKRPTTQSAIGMDSFNGEAYSEVKFNFYLKRKPLYFMTNLIIPCCLMSVIVLFVFLLPANADEKISLSITVLLSFSVFQLLVVGSMPETSDYVPLISQSLFELMLLFY